MAIKAKNKMFSRSTATTYCIRTTIFLVKYFGEPVYFGLWGQLESEPLLQASALGLLFSLESLKYCKKLMVPVNTLRSPTSSTTASLPGFRRDASTMLLNPKANDTPPGPLKKIIGLRLCSPSPPCHYKVTLKKKTNQLPQQHHR